jgi:A/G-specific adenine glycosylase
MDDVLKHWQGLGYYARARNLHRAAQVIQERHQGTFPTEFADILALPGIGPYTAGAICSIALGRETPIVDANVIRVLCRYFGLRGDPKSPNVQDQLWTLAKELIPTGQASAFNQGMMELGALLCQSKPECSRCPVQDGCIAFSSGKPEALPEFAPKPEFTRQTDICAIVRHPQKEHCLLLVQRPQEGLWGGLWEFPRVTQEEEESNADAAGRAAREIAGLQVNTAATVLTTVRHGVTTRKITLIAVECQLIGPDTPAPPTGFTAAWVPGVDVDRLALSSPQAKLWKQLQSLNMQLSLFG